MIKIILLSGKACSKFSKEGITASQVVQKINMKCVEARRPQRIRAPTSAKNAVPPPRPE